MTPWWAWFAFLRRWYARKHGGVWWRSIAAMEDGRLVNSKWTWDLNGDASYAATGNEVSVHFVVENYVFH